jgi:hypothetical protein
MKSFDRSITESELQDMIRENDVDGKGTVDFVEFCMLMEFKLEVYAVWFSFVCLPNPDVLLNSNPNYCF